MQADIPLVPEPNGCFSLSHKSKDEMAPLSCHNAFSVVPMCWYDCTFWEHLSCSVETISFITESVDRVVPERGWRCLQTQLRWTWRCPDAFGRWQCAHRSAQAEVACCHQSISDTRAHYPLLEGSAWHRTWHEATLTDGHRWWQQRDKVLYSQQLQGPQAKALEGSGVCKACIGDS